MFGMPLDLAFISHYFKIFSNMRNLVKKILENSSLVFVIELKETEQNHWACCHFYKKKMAQGS